MHQIEDLGKLTGGRSVEHASIDSPLVLKILDSFRADAPAQYVIGLEPDSNAPGGYRLIVFSVAAKFLHLRSQITLRAWAGLNQIRRECPQFNPNSRQTSKGDAGRCEKSS